MSKSYGKPSEITKIPTSSALKIAREARKVREIERSATLLESMATEQEDAFLAAEIQAGRWQPVAQWKFKNARVWVAILAKDPDESGVRPTSVTWSFMEWPRFVKWYEAAKKADKPRDF